MDSSVNVPNLIGISSTKGKNTSITLKCLL